MLEPDLSRFQFVHNLDQMQEMIQLISPLVEQVPVNAQLLGQRNDVISALQRLHGHLPKCLWVSAYRSVIRYGGFKYHSLGNRNSQLTRTRHYAQREFCRSSQWVPSICHEKATNSCEEPAVSI